MKNLAKRIIKVVVTVIVLACLLKVISVIPMWLTINQINRVARDATRITIIQGSMCEDDKLIGEVLAEVSDLTEINSFFSALHIESSLAQLFCMQCACGGDLEVRIDRKNAEPFQFTIHHGQSIRIPKTIAGDAAISSRSAFRLAIWLSRQGVYDKGNVQQIRVSRVP